MPLRSLTVPPGVALLTAAALTSPAWSQSAPAPPPTSCWAQADKKGAHGEARTNFQKPCVGGVMAPTDSSYNNADARAAQALAAPSDADDASRSQTCAAAADDKGRGPNQRKSIRSDCMAANATPAAANAPAPPEPPAVQQASDPSQSGATPHAP